MKAIISLLVFGGFFLAGCEEDVRIQHEPFETKSVERFDKEPGYFANSRSYVYQFEKVMKSGGRNMFNRISIQVEIPGLPTVTAISKIISDPAVYSPLAAQQFLYIVPDRPLLIQWSGGAWNEVDIRFEIDEMYRDSTAIKYIHFQKVNQVLINGMYYQIRIPFELIVQEIDKTFKVDRNIIKRYFGPVCFTIHTGLKEYATYIEYLNGINDFNENPFSNIEGALGLVTSRSSINKGPMLLDQSSRMEFAQDPVLQKLNFIEY